MAATDFREDFLTALKEKISSESDWLSNMANFSALIYQKFPKINWVGFYLLRKDKNILQLGPFQGLPAVSKIEVGDGVCGTAVAEEEVQRVDNVHEFPGHIVCDCASESELVIPIWLDQKIIGVLDVDSPIRARFSEEDQQLLVKALKELVTNSDFKDFFIK